MTIGDLCRTREGAPARYVGRGKCLFIGSQDNDPCVADAVTALGGEEKFPLPCDEQVREAWEKLKGENRA